MSPLERELGDLRLSLEWPEAPDVTAAVTRRIASPRVGRRRPGRLLFALALALLALAAALAVPPARAAILDWLGIGGARIVRVDELPALTPRPGLEILGERVSLAEARSRAGFPVAAPPDGEPSPTEVRVAPGGRVSYVWRDGAAVRLLVTQFPGTASDPALVKKLAGSSTSVEQLELDGDPAVWLEGGPHAVLFVAPDGSVRREEGWLAGNTLLVDRDGVTIRVEGALERDEATELVRGMPR